MTSGILLQQMECARILIERSIYFAISVFKYTRAKICINNSMRTSLCAVELFFFLSDPYDIVKGPFFGIGAYLKFTESWNRRMRYGEEMIWYEEDQHIDLCNKNEGDVILCVHKSRTNLHSFCILL
jgi:hypothetical protein